MKSQGFTGIGSWSTGSLKLEDLIPAALDCLKTLDPVTHKAKQAEWNTVDDVDAWDEADCFYGEISDAIDGKLPPYLYWGSHEGDGADVGVWISHDSIADDRRSGELPSGDQLPDAVPGVGSLFLVVSDHGNMELYSAAQNDGVAVWHSVWSCV